ncbi:DUF3810 domain-containing protein [Clostridium sp. C2-6-12]|uniref:DUF3810 domain-containing protein n=1 Tax=Clostridium sp. C2-6-12 TaxID=2698832 RepID=UPI001FAD2171|nr:DUF3810 domain-containing protein [Clostridium sp. C2-6-12]
MKIQKLSLKNQFIISGTLLGISGILFIFSRVVPKFADIYYKYIYLTLINTIGRLISVVSFSIYEMVLYGFLLFIIYKIIMYIVLRFKRKLFIKEILLRVVSNLLMYISIFIFLNMITLGVNSFRTDFVTSTGLKIEEGSEEKLSVLCGKLKEKLNELDDKVNRDENGFLKLDDSIKEDGIESMKNLSSINSDLEGFYTYPKPYVFSRTMSYQFLEGETDFTLEANYNNDMPKCNVPSTICHELSHVRGFNNEYEANYISFLACINSKKLEYQYSGYLMAYSYCMNDLYNSNLEEFKKINNELSDNVKRELKNDSLYWNSYRGKISEIHSETYDKLLKATGQEEGIRSYNAVVKLLISGYEKQFDFTNYIN